jgi:hypothetical protein
MLHYTVLAVLFYVGLTEVAMQAPAAEVTRCKVAFLTKLSLKEGLTAIALEIFDQGTTRTWYWCLHIDLTVMPEMEQIFGSDRDANTLNETLAAAKDAAVAMAYQSGRVVLTKATWIEAVQSVVKVLAAMAAPSREVSDC